LPGMAELQIKTDFFLAYQEFL